MKKLTFKVSSQKDCSVVSLIKEVNKISCRIYLDIENGYVTVENVSDTMIDAVIELVDNYYTILGVEIDNTFEETLEKQVVPVVTESTADTTDDTVEETVEETTEAVAAKQPTILEPQSEDDLIIKKVEFENEYVENLINKFLKTAAWAMFKMNVSEKEIGDFIYSSINEVSLRYNPFCCIDYYVGDIVDCNYGTHLSGEINGNHVHSIVCDISANGMVYLVPITKMQTDLTSSSYLIFNAPEDVIYENDYYKGGTALLDKAKYVRAERLNAVVGKTNPAFFKKLLHQLASTFDFTGCLSDTVVNTTDVSDEYLTATVDSVDKVSSTSVSTEINTDEVIDKPTETSESKSSTNKVGGVEAALMEAIGPSFDKLDKSLSVEEQVKNFITEIGMPKTAKLVAQSFIIACYIKKINYENIILELRKSNPNINEDIIKRSLQEDFKRWLEKYPKLAEKCPKISLMSLLKVFNKKLSEE